MRFRGRLLLSVLLSASVVAGGLAMDSRLGARVPAEPAVPAEESGLLLCPHGGGEGYRAWVVAANPGTVPADLRVTTYAAGADAVTTAARLEPGTHRYFEVGAPRMAAASTVEFFGAEVGAGVVVAGPDGVGLAAEPCSAQAGSTWYVPESSTLRGEEAHVVVFNPFATDAVVDMTLLAGDRLLRPSAFKGVVLGPGETRSFPLNRFALGEDALAARVTAVLGRVGVSGVVIGKAGLRSTLAVRAPSRIRALPGTGDGPEGALVIATPTALEVPFRAAALTADGEVPALDLELLPGGTAGAFPIETPDAGLVVTADGDRPFVAGRRLVPAAPEPPAPPAQGGGGGAGGGGDQRGGTGGSGAKGPRKGEREEKPAPPPEPPEPDLASTAGAIAVASLWVVPPAVPPEGGPAALVLENPGNRPARALVTYIGEAGAQGDPADLTVGPRSVVRLDLPPGPPVTAVVDVTDGSLVPAQVALDPKLYAVAVGLPTD
jgi:Family of unknown function (DUF5719)